MKAETWNKQVQQEGIVVTVPEGAQQALLFLAPETGGDFATLRSAVRGRPGAFVRASQDLNQAALDRSRLDTYLASIKEAADTDPKLLKERSLNSGAKPEDQGRRPMLRQTNRGTSSVPPAKSRPARAR